MKNIIIGQSGGPTSAINASLAGAYKEAKKQGFNKVYGMVHGIEGLLNGDVVDLDEYLSNNENYELLKRTPSSFLGSCRYKLPKLEDDREVYEKLMKVMDKYSSDYLIYIGGNDSMDTVKMLSNYAKENNIKKYFMGVPKTIDNDLGVTDHCPGYGSAAKYIAVSIREVIRDNAVYGKTKPTVSVVEIMGRHAGWLTAASALSKDDSCEGVDAIYLPEIPFDEEEFVKMVEKKVKEKSAVVVAVSEGIKTKDDKFVCELLSEDKKTDAFGHKELSGCAETLCNILKQRTNYKTRSIELSTLQRAGSHLASLTDIKEAERCGMEGVKAINKGKTGKMVVMYRKDDNNYKIRYSLYDINKIANVEKKVPLEWIDVKNHQVTKELVNYMMPLIQGEVKQIYKNGIPQHLVRK